MKHFHVRIQKYVQEYVQEFFGSLCIWGVNETWKYSKYPLTGK